MLYLCMPCIIKYSTWYILSILYINHEMNKINFTQYASNYIKRCACNAQWYWLSINSLHSNPSVLRYKCIAKHFTRSVVVKFNDTIFRLFQFLYVIIWIANTVVISKREVLELDICREWGSKSESTLQKIKM
jgi:hypothetical protein